MMWKLEASDNHIAGSRRRTTIGPFRSAWDPRALLPGAAHEACDDGTAALVALTEIRDALEGDDVTMLASALMKERAGVSAEFVPEGGRIDLILACDPYKPFRTIPVLPEVRRALEGELQQTDRDEFTAAEPAR